MAAFAATFIPPALVLDESCISSTSAGPSSSYSARSAQVQICRFRSKKLFKPTSLLIMTRSYPLFSSVLRELRKPARRPQRVSNGGGSAGMAWAFAMELAEEAKIPGRRDPLKSPDVPPLFNDQQGELSLPRPPRNNADNASLHNPLLRLHRMGCGWLGVIMEWDGVMVEDDSKLEREAWVALAQEEGRRPPPAFVLRKAEGMKSEQAISEVLCWSRDPKEMKRLGQRKEEIFQELQGATYQQKLGSRDFVLTLKKYKVPIALASTRPRRVIEKAIEAVGLEGEFNVVVTAEDVYRGKPDPEMYMYAAQLLDVIPERCIVIGNSNSSVEAAHDTFMKCIAVAGKHPIYELGAADLVITRLNDLSFVDLKNLADLDSPEFQPPEPQPEMEPEEEPLIQTRVALSDRW